MNNNIVVGAHYDDAELGAGGSMARLVYEGKKVYKITLTDTEVFSTDMGLNIKGERARENSTAAC